MEKHVANAKELANWLSHDQIEWVNYTGFEDHESYDACKKYLNGNFPTVFTFGLKVVMIRQKIHR